MSSAISEGLSFLICMIMQATPAAPIEHPDVLKLKLEAAQRGYAEYYDENEVIQWRWKEVDELKKMKAEAVRRGFAEFYVDDTSDNPKWRWKENQK